MDAIKIPESAIGKVGMIASLKRLPDDVVGKLVLVKEPAGMVSTLVGSDKAVFAWVVILLGEKVTINGRESRHMYVPDACLVPVSQLSESELEVLSKQTNEADFNVALGELAAVVGAEQLTWDEVESGIERAANIFAINACLQDVATPVALQEIGFRPSKKQPDSLEWALVHDGVELRFSATADPFDTWHLIGTGSSQRTAMFDERLVQPEVKRGEIFLRLLSMYRSAFPQAPCPPELEIAEIYERYLAEKRRLNVGLPRLNVDGQIFRATLKWISERHDDLLNENLVVELGYDGSLLKISVGGVTYGCPANGNLIGTCCLSLNDLLSLPPHDRRGISIPIEQGASELVIGKCSVPRVAVEPV